MIYLALVGRIESAIYVSWWYVFNSGSVKTKHATYHPNILPTTLPYSTRTTNKAIKYTTEMTMLAFQHAISIGIALSSRRRCKPCFIAADRHT